MSLLTHTKYTNKRSYFSYSFLLLLGLLFTTVSFANNHNRTLDFADIFNIEYADNPQYHSSGEWLIYERVSMDKYKDRQRRQLWQLHPSSDRHSPLVSSLKNSYGAVFSNKGDKVAFLSSTDKGTEIFVYLIKTGDLIQLSELDFSPSNLAWSPSDKEIAFTQFTPLPEQALFSDLPKPPKGADWAPAAKFIDSVLYRGDGAGYLDKGHTQIYKISSEGGSALQITQEAFNHSGPLTWSRANNLIYFSSNRHENWEMMPMNSDIYSLNPVTGDIAAITELSGPASQAVLSKNGEYIAFSYVDDRKLSYQVNQIMLLNLKTNKVTALTAKLDRAIQNFQWQGNDKGLLMSYIDHGKTKLAELSLKGKITPLKVELGSQSLGRPYATGDFTVSRNNDIVYTANNPLMPADLALYDTSKKNNKVMLTQLNNDALGHITLAKTRALSVKSSIDNLAIDLWVAYPPNYEEKVKQGKKFPLILEIHGGPHAAYGNTFSLEIQLMAAKGYVVVWSNPRGSSSYGEDFGNTIHHNYPSNDYQDLMDAVNAVIETDSIDSNNLFVTGGSGGGVLTAWTVGKTDRFAAAVVAKPVINWFSFALTADAYPFFSQYWMPGKPWEVQEHLWKHSPISLVGNVSTPTMLLTGEDDYRTPISESEQYYQALQLAGVKTAMVRIPGAGHGIAARPTHLMQKIGNILAWFERHKKPE